MESLPLSALARQKAARAALDDTAQLLGLYHVVSQAEAPAPPTAYILDGKQPLQSATRVGFFAGSFNPLTYAHIGLADAARRAAALDTVIWTMAGITVDKERVQRASVTDRLAQMSAYLRDNVPADVLAVVNRGLYVEEAQALRQVISPDAVLYIIAGYDKILQIFDPRYYADRDAALRELFSLVRILVAPRDGNGTLALTHLLGKRENRQFARYVRIVETSPARARDSSTEARLLGSTSPLPVPALRGLVPPEALALVRTGAYAPCAEDRARDRYALRARWLHALDIADSLPGAALPPLSRLVSRASRSTAEGERLRRWLQDPVTVAAPAEARRILVQR